MEGSVCSAVHVDQICWHIKMWNWIVKHDRMGFEDVPLCLRDSVMTLALIDNGKVKRAMDESVRVSEIDIVAVWK
jgi:hypothetical protein